MLRRNFIGGTVAAVCAAIRASSGSDDRYEITPISDESYQLNLVAPDSHRYMSGVHNFTWQSDYDWNHWNHWESEKIMCHWPCPEKIRMVDPLFGYCYWRVIYVNDHSKLMHVNLHECWVGKTSCRHTSGIFTREMPSRDWANYSPE